MKKTAFEAFEAREMKRLAKLQAKQNKVNDTFTGVKATNEKKQLAKLLQTSIAYDTTLHKDLVQVFKKHINRTKKENNQYFKKLGVCDTICKKYAEAFINTGNTKFINNLTACKYEVCYNMIAEANKLQKATEKATEKAQQKIDKVSEYYEAIFAA